MPLESLGKGKLNIKRVAETTPGRVPDFFDAHTEMTHEKMCAISEDLTDRMEKYRVGEEFPSSYFAKMVQLFPEEKSWMGLDDRFLSLFKDDILYARKTPNDWRSDPVGHFTLLVAHALVLFPDQTREQLGVFDSDWSAVKDRISVSLPVFTSGNTGSLVLGHPALIVASVMAFPEYADVLKSQSEKYEYFKTILWRGELDALQAVSLFADMRLMFNDLMTDAELKALGREKKILAAREQATTSCIYGEVYIDYLYACQVLAAEKVEVTQRGVKFTMPEKQEFGTTIPPLPELKK